MADPVTRPDVVIDLDRPRTLRFDVNAYAEIEERSGQLLGALLLRIRGMASLRWLLWGCLLHESPALSVADVGVLLQAHWFEKGKSMGDLSPLITQAIDRSQIFKPAKEKKKDGPEGNAPAEAKASSASATG